MNDTKKSREQLVSELNELRRQVAQLRAGEARHKQDEETLVRLASFPEQNPDPVIETDLKGVVTYLNPIARERFPDLQQAGLQHPLLQGLPSIIQTLEEGIEDSVLHELEAGEFVYEQKT